MEWKSKQRTKARLEWDVRLPVLAKEFDKNLYLGAKNLHLPKGRCWATLQKAPECKGCKKEERHRNET